jgi:hypothetical protein
MKFFQQLLVAPAALGLLAPVAANAADLNISGVNRYSAADEQVTSISQFSDVKPTDWAYQALSNLIERYGCVAGYPNGTFKGGQAMTRYEAAALLNACLDRISEVTDELKRLMKEFEKELAVLKGRVDGLEAKVGELEANQFSTTTKLNGKATFVLGGNSYGGGYRTTPLASRYSGFPVGSKYATEAAQASGATTFNYDLQLNFDTSFTGKDLLRTRLRAGNFAQSAYAGNAPVGLTGMEAAFEENCGTGMDCGDVVAVNRLYYQFPIGSGFTATVGGRVRQDDMLAVWPSAYPADTVLDVFTYAGAPGTYSLNLGGGAGLWWKSGGFSVSANYVSANADNARPGPTTSFGGQSTCASSGGFATDCSASTGTVQIAYTGSNYGLAAAYTYSQPNGLAGLYGGNGTPFAVAAFGSADNVNSVGLSAYWSPTNSGLIPSISVGWGTNSYSASGPAGVATVDGMTSQSWYVGLQWADAFMKGNTLGMAVGEPTFVTSLGDLRNANLQDVRSPRDGNYAWEWWYKFQVTDNISVTPALYYLSAPLGQGQRSPLNTNSTFNNFGGLIKTTFKF